MDKDKLIETFDLLDVFEDKSVQQPDIIRYCRLWIILNKQ